MNRKRSSLRTFQLLVVTMSFAISFQLSAESWTYDPSCNACTNTGGGIVGGIQSGPCFGPIDALWVSGIRYCQNQLCKEDVSSQSNCNACTCCPPQAAGRFACLARVVEAGCQYEAWCASICCEDSASISKIPTPPGCDGMMDTLHCNQ